MFRNFPVMGRGATEANTPVSGQAAFLSPRNADHGDKALGETAESALTGDEPAHQAVRA